MTTYEVYLLLHIAAAIVWIGAAFMMVLLVTRARLERDAARMWTFAREGEWLGLRLFLPANLVVLVSAVLLVHEGDWGYDALWIRLGIAGFAASFIAGALFFGPGWGRAGRLAAREGLDAAPVETAVGRLLFGAWLDVGWLLGIVFVMTVKPEPHEWGALAVTAAIPVAFGLAGAGLSRSPAPGSEHVAAPSS